MLVSSALFLAALTSCLDPEESRSEHYLGQIGSQTYALMPARVIPNSRPLSWNRSSQSLALAGIAGFPNRRGARQTLQNGGRLPSAFDRKLLRYHLDTDTVDEVFNANPGFGLMQVKWLGQTADLAFGLENVEGRQVGAVVSRRGLEPKVVSFGDDVSLITLATSSELPVLLVCQSGSERSRVTAYSLDQTVEVTKLPEGLIAATLRESENPGYALLVGIADSSSSGADTFGIDLRTAKIVPESSIAAFTPARTKPVFDFALRPAPVPTLPGERNDVFAEKEGVQPIFLCRNARSAVSSPDGLKTAVWDGASTFVFEFVAVKGK